MNARNARFLVAALAAIVMLCTAVAVLRPFDAFAGATVTAKPSQAPVVSRREYLARLVAETAARAAEDAARHPPAQHPAAASLPDDGRIAGDPAP